MKNKKVPTSDESHGGYVIRKNIPLPNQTKEMRGAKVSIIRKMEVGDSIIASSDRKLSWYPIARQIGRKVTIRSISPTEIAIWRTA